MKVVLDTNVLISAALRAGSPPYRILRAWRAGQFSVVCSQDLLDEVVQVLARPRIARRTEWSEADRAALFADLREVSVWVEPQSQIRLITADPADNRVLEAAIAGQADYIVSGDQHLLEIGEYQGVLIVTPARFVAVLALT